MIPQSIFYCHNSSLKTKVCLSYIDHDKWIRHNTPYDILFLDHMGRLAKKISGTICVGETKYFSTDELFGPADHFYGNCICLIDVRDLGSFRIFASWYNEYSITTTHEKGAYSNNKCTVIYPLVVEDQTHNTYLVICNASAQDCQLQMCPMKADGKASGEWVSYNIGSKQSLFKPVLELVPCESISDFDYLILKKNPVNMMYYYFVHNTRYNSWQMQHL